MRILVGLLFVFAATLADQLSTIDLTGVSPAVAIVNTTESYKSGRAVVQEPKSIANQGVRAVHGFFPYHVALVTNTEKFCSGTLVSVDKVITVITAAHCVSGAKDATVYAGINSLDGNERIQVRHSIKITPHPRYNATSMENDIAVISINKATPFSPNTWVQALNMSSIAFEGKWARTSGWGSTGNRNEYLRYEDFTIISNKECQETFGKYVTNTTICAVPQTNRTNCVLDSGSPLVDVESGKLIGVATFTSESTVCSTASPVAYARINFDITLLN